MNVCHAGIRILEKDPNKKLLNAVDQRRENESQTPIYILNTSWNELLINGSSPSLWIYPWCEFSIIFSSI